MRLARGDGVLDVRRGREVEKRHLEIAQAFSLTAFFMAATFGAARSSVVVEVSRSRCREICGSGWRWRGSTRRGPPSRRGNSVARSGAGRCGRRYGSAPPRGLGGPAASRRASSFARATSLFLRLLLPRSPWCRRRRGPGSMTMRRELEPQAVRRAGFRCRRCRFWALP